MDTENPILEVMSLKKEFNTNSSLIKKVFSSGESNTVKAIDNLSLSLGENECQGIIGESGCGKTTLLRTLIGLYSATSGKIKFKGECLDSFSRSDWKSMRRNVQIIFQNPFNSLNPKMTIEEILTEPLTIHGMEKNKESKVNKVLEDVELNPPSKYLDQKPPHLSGGEKQRVAIARALILEPDLILADEPVSMLDVSTQASILSLLSNLIHDYGVSMLYISHDLSTVSYLCDSINVMYLGRIVESGPTDTVLEDSKHPYTQALVNAIPIPDPDYGRERTMISTDINQAEDNVSGCRFKDRCPERMKICDEQPIFKQVEPDHSVACHLHYEHDNEN